MCQSSPRPPVALYWHIGETTMRLRAVTERKLIGWNSRGVCGMRMAILKRRVTAAPPVIARSVATKQSPA